MISQFFILSPRGDTIIVRDYLGNVPKVFLAAIKLLSDTVWMQNASFSCNTPCRGGVAHGDYSTPAYSTCARSCVLL